MLSIHRELIFFLQVYQQYQQYSYLPGSYYLPCMHTHTHTELILIICVFYICKFAYLLKFICDLKISTCGTFTVICGCAISCHRKCTFPAKVEQGNILSSCFSSRIINKYSFHGLFGATFFCNFGNSAFKMVPKHCRSTEVLSSFLKSKKAVMRLMKKIRCLK